MRDERSGDGAGVRGVFEAEFPFPGLREFRVITAAGKKAVEIKILDGWLEEGLLEYLKRLLGRKDAE